MPSDWRSRRPERIHDHALPILRRCLWGRTIMRCWRCLGGFLGSCAARRHCGNIFDVYICGTCCGADHGRVCDAELSWVAVDGVFLCDHGCAWFPFLNGIMTDLSGKLLCSGLSPLCFCQRHHMHEFFSIVRGSFAQRLRTGPSMPRQMRRSSLRRSLWNDTSPALFV